MKAHLLYEAGGFDKLMLGETSKPVLKNGEVLVKIKAIGINSADTIYRNSDVFGKRNYKISYRQNISFYRNAGSTPTIGNAPNYR